MKVPHWESWCVGLPRSPPRHRGRGLSGTGGSVHPVLELLRGDVCPGGVREVLGSVKKPCPRWRCPRPTLLLQPGRKVISPSHRAETFDSPALVAVSMFNPVCPERERLCLELATAGNGKQGIVSHWIPRSSTAPTADGAADARGQGYSRPGARHPLWHKTVDKRPPSVPFGQQTKLVRN